MEASRRYGAGWVKKGDRYDRSHTLWHPKNQSKHCTFGSDIPVLVSFMELFLRNTRNGVLLDNMNKIRYPALSFFDTCV